MNWKLIIKYKIVDWLYIPGTFFCVVAYFNEWYILSVILFIGLTPSLEEVIGYYNYLKKEIPRSSSTS